MSQATKPDTAGILAGLKDFQRATVDHVFRRLYVDEQPTRRFLVADEVGLGKTLVARGVIARVIDHLWDKVGRIDVIYICSNADIARQNINRLNVTDREDFALASRITLLPVSLKGLKQNRINFVSFTPSTSFDLKSNMGKKEERALIYWLLQQAWNLSGAAPLNVLQGSASRENFRDLVKGFRDDHEIDEGLADGFRLAVLRHIESARQEGRDDIRARFDQLCERFAKARDNVPAGDHKDRVALVGELRNLLAVTCLEALEPDLIVLDEFQRFKHLLNGTDKASDLARGLFEFPDNRVLLLSATPYKMYTLEEEAEVDDHYADFLRTLTFLQGGAGQAEAFAELLRQYRREIFALANGGLERVRLLKGQLETQLRAVMVRTERLAVSSDRSGMLAHVDDHGAVLKPADVGTYVGLQRVSRLLEEGDGLEYWKAAPYLLNFMDGYALKETFEAAVEDRTTSTRLRQELVTHKGLLLDWADVTRYQALDRGNARLRSLWDDTVGKGLWRLLWLPPSLRYHKLGGVFSDWEGENVTKRLVFSSWRVVPKVIASLLSYEAERQMLRGFEAEPENTPEARKRRRGLLRFARADVARSDMRLTGMPVLGILYPSQALARVCDPIDLAREAPGASGPASLADTLTVAEQRVSRLLERVRSELDHRVYDSTDAATPDESWYWAAPILLDCLDDRESTARWLKRSECADNWAGEAAEADEDGDESAWADHVDRARKAARASSVALILGPPPADLARVMALIGLAGPGVVALRALQRVVGRVPGNLDSVKDAAGSVAWALRGLFNLPEVSALIRGRNADEPYWLRVVEYCADGGLQAVLDEHAHVLRESLGLVDKPMDEAAGVIAETMKQAIGLRTAAVGVHSIHTDGPGVRLEAQRLRARFAVRFGEEEADDGRGANRAEQVRTAFNSPFWPFVLATTSVGQEGLDFHQYCHAVVHWNLPSNPVDLEQREGRVHRYKGHAVRKNVARHCVQMGASPGVGDPWAALFAMASSRRGDASEINPYWVYAIDGGAVIERHVPALPLSRDQHRFIELRKALAVYRMVFGQARQEEIVSYLLNKVPADRVAAALQELQIDLGPPSGAVEQAG